MISGGFVDDDWLVFLATCQHVGREHLLLVLPDGCRAVKMFF